MKGKGMGGAGRGAGWMSEIHVPLLFLEEEGIEVRKVSLFFFLFTLVLLGSFIGMKVAYMGINFTVSLLQVTICSQTDALRDP